MVTMTCPWCEVDLKVDPADLDAAESACPDCSTAWLTGEPVAQELLLAA